MGDVRQDRFSGTVAATSGYLALEGVPHRIPRQPALAGSNAGGPAPASAEAALDAAGLDTEDPATLVRALSRGCYSGCQCLS